MTKRLKMTDSLNSILHSFLVNNGTRSKKGFHAKALTNQALQNFDLHLTHDLRMDFREALIPDNVELRDFFF